MSEATTVSVAEAVLAEITGDAELLPSDAIVARGYNPKFALEDMDTLHVTVVPRAVERRRITRTLTERDLRIDISIQRRVGDDDQDQLDAMMLQAEQVLDFLDGRELAQYPEAVFVEIANDPVYIQEHLDQMRQFTSVLTVTYRLMR